MPTANGFSVDTLHELSVFAPHATQLLRQVSKNFENPQNMTVSDSGDTYMVDFPDANQPNVAIVNVAPGKSRATTFFSPLSGSNVVLYNGKRFKGCDPGVAVARRTRDEALSSASVNR